MGLFYGGFMSFENTNNGLVKRLTQAISELEGAIIAATDTIRSKPQCPSEAIERLRRYMLIVEQQRNAIPRIVELISKPETDELRLEINRINALSEMVRDDAKELLTFLANPLANTYRPDPN